MIRVVHVNVTQEDIEQGEACMCYTCPIALALQRTLGRRVAVDTTGWRYSDGPTSNEQKQPTLWHGLPATVCAFIWDFDSHGNVAPFEFDLTVPA